MLALCVPEVRALTALRLACCGLWRSPVGPGWPWSHISLDFVTGLPPSQDKTTILTIIDRFSKAAHFIPLDKLPSSSETSDLLINHVFRLHGIPSNPSSSHRFGVPSALLWVLRVSEFWLPPPVSQTNWMA